MITKDLDNTLNFSHLYHPKNELISNLLEEAIAHTFSQCIHSLQNSPKYHIMTNKFIWGYRLLYIKNMSLTAIAHQLDLTGERQANHLLKPYFFINQVKNYIFDKMMIKRENLLPTLLNNPDELQNFSQSLNDYLFQIIVLPAWEDLNSRSKYHHSLFSQKMCLYFNTIDF